MTDPRVTDDRRRLHKPLDEMRGQRSHGWVLWALMAAVILIPLAEITILIQTGRMIGLGWTILLMLATSFLGAWLMKREGGKAWRALVDAFSGGRMPTGELADGALVLVGGTLLMLPGFLSDVLGMFFLTPFTRPLARKALSYAFARDTTSLELHRPGPVGPTDPTLIEGEVVDGPVQGDVQDADGHVVREIRR